SNDPFYMDLTAWAMLLLLALVWGDQSFAFDLVDPACCNHPWTPISGRSHKCECLVWFFCHCAWFCDHGWTSFQDTQIEPKLSR
ncbi:MAG: hypothetical protein VW474_14325, partial [Paracoccaceae bacterium]